MHKKTEKLNPLMKGTLGSLVSLVIFLIIATDERGRAKQAIETQGRNSYGTQSKASRVGGEMKPITAASLMIVPFSLSFLQQRTRSEQAPARWWRCIAAATRTKSRSGRKL